MTEAVIFASAILTALYVIVRDAPPQPQRQPQRHRPWNFK
jgi:hypothetical protein